MAVYLTKLFLISDESDPFKRNLFGFRAAEYCLFFILTNLQKFV